MSYGWKGIIVNPCRDLVMVEDVVIFPTFLKQRILRHYPLHDFAMRNKYTMLHLFGLQFHAIHSHVFIHFILETRV